MAETVGADAAAIDECIDAGLLTLQGETLAFRHDLARRAIEDGLPPLRRRELDRRVLAALEAAGDADPARLAHHARRAGDAGAIRRLAPVAARAASAAGGHRQALEHWEAALAAARRMRGGARGRRRSRRTCAGAPSARSRRAARC